MNYIEASSIESRGGAGSDGVKIMLSFPHGLSGDAIRIAQRHADQILREVRTANALADPKVAAEKAEIKQLLTGLFETPIYVQEIPNEHCSEYCCFGRPWFIVTTGVGPIKIGWRKRVISIDWSGSQIGKTAKELFPDDDVTKEGRSIDAWSYQDALHYLRKLGVGKETP